jgi:hypothetical protein
MKTATVILEYCGGSRTDSLVERLQAWNPGREIEVLDNASPANRSRYITRHNTVNTYIGGGIIDCCKLSQARNCDNLFFLVNDIEPLTPIVVDEFEHALASNPNVVQLAASITRDSSPQAIVYPWMVTQGSPVMRRVPHSDLLCCIMRNSFIRSFGGFPVSKGGWGYDLELAYQAFTRGLHIAVADWCVVRHENSVSVAVQQSRYHEMLQVYASRYPNREFDVDLVVAEGWRRGLIRMSDKQDSLSSAAIGLEAGDRGQ